MIESRYIAPDYCDLFREDAVVRVEQRSETEGVIVDSQWFCIGPPVPAIGDSVRLPEGNWRKASFVPPLDEGRSLTDPSNLIVVGHAGRRVMASDGMTGTAVGWNQPIVRIIMDDGSERSLSLMPSDGSWVTLARSVSCRSCRRPISIYTPFLVCGACAEERGDL